MLKMSEPLIGQVMWPGGKQVAVLRQQAWKTGGNTHVEEHPIPATYLFSCTAFTT